MGPPNPAAVKLGYEPDGYDTTSVMSVPVLVIVFFVLAFGTTTILFAYLTRSQDYSGAHPQAAERNKAPLSERIGRINRGTGEVDQPRLEPLRIRDDRGADPRAITRPETKTGNPPYLHPEDSRAEPGRTDELFAKARGKSLDKVISEASPKDFPVQKQGTKPTPSWHLVSAMNAGRGADHATAEPPPLPNPPEPKKEEPKKDEKKEEPKKEEPKKNEPPKGPTPPEVKK